MACPGSVRLSGGIPAQPSSPHAREGTQAHAVAELALKSHTQPRDFVGTRIEGELVTEVMADFVTIYTDYCLGLKLGKAAHSNRQWIEHRFTLEKLEPPTPMFGTADFVSFDNASRTLDVVDLKYGTGLTVEVEGNVQLRYYALGACLSLGLDPEVIRMTIVQPRKEHADGVIRTETITGKELTRFASDLLHAARETTQPDAPLNPGAHCRWCPASGQCPAQRDQAQAVARIEFAVAESHPPVPSTIPDALFAEMLAKLPILDNWISAMRATAMARLERGEEVPGFKLVQTRPTRYWVRDQLTKDYLLANGITMPEMMETKLKSPAQIETLLGKKKKLPEHLVEKRSSGRSMVPLSDKRPAVTVTAGEEFPLLSAGDTQPAGRNE